jgi:hypothetical protein
MKQKPQYSIDGSMVTETEFLKKRMFQLNVAGINHVIEPFLEEINRQRGQIEYKNDVGVSSVKVHNVSPDLSNRIQNEIDQNRLDY